MDTNFDLRLKELRRKTTRLRNTFSKAGQNTGKFTVTMPMEFEEEFFRLVDFVSLSLLEDQDNFFGYFLFQMGRELRFNINSPTAVYFKDSTYILCFNPLLFLMLNIRQMESTIKHEILHIVSLHHLRAKSMKHNYNKLTVNMAMDIVVNRYLKDLPPDATTLEWVNKTYSLHLEPYGTMEYYADALQEALKTQNKEQPPKAAKNQKEPGPEFEEDPLKEEDPLNEEDSLMEDQVFFYDPATTHDLWEESSELDDKTLQEFTQKLLLASEKGEIPSYVQGMLASLKEQGGELPWNLYLNRLMGTIEGEKKKTVTRKSRRQPERSDLRGELRSHKAKIAVAIDISGSISDEEFKQAMQEVLNIVKNYNHEMTILECDNELRQVYQVKSVRDLKDRTNTRGGTSFSPVIEYANRNRINLLIYFTDGKGENQLKPIPRGYQILWVISGRGEALSLRKPYGTMKKLRKIEVIDNRPEPSEVVASGFSMAHQERLL